MKKILGFALLAFMVFVVKAEAGIVTKPYTFSAGSKILSAQVNADFDALFNLINGNLDSTNIAASATITDNKFATITTAGKVQDTAVFGTTWSDLTDGGNTVLHYHTASQTPIIDVAGYYANTNVEGALYENGAAIASITTKIGGAPFGFLRNYGTIRNGETYSFVTGTANNVYSLGTTLPSNPGSPSYYGPIGAFVSIPVVIIFPYVMPYNSVYTGVNNLDYQVSGATYAAINVGTSSFDAICRTYRSDGTAYGGWCSWIAIGQ